jgi:hypothetical protein
MKEPFFALAGITALVTVSGAAESHAQAERIGAMLAAGLCSCLYSLWKSKKRKADRHDTAIWAMIALVGSMSLGWFGGPIIADTPLPLLDGVQLPGVPFCTWLLAIGGAPLIEAMLDGRAGRKVLERIGLITIDEQAR